MSVLVITAALPFVGVNCVVTRTRIACRRSSARIRASKAHVIVTFPAFFVRRCVLQIVDDRFPAAMRVAVCRITPGPVTVTVVVRACPAVRGFATRNVVAARSGATAVALGVTGAEALDALDVPAVLVATAVNVYAVPFVSPVIVQVPEAPLMRHDWPPGAAVTVISEGVLEGKATDVVTAALASPAVAVGVAGVHGAASAVARPSSEAVQPVEAER